MDCIILIIGGTFQDTDGEIMRQCQRLDIPTYAVRSRYDIAIKGELNDEDSQHAGPNKLEKARRVVRHAIEGNVKRELGRYKGLHRRKIEDQRVYLVNQRSIMKFVGSNFDAGSSSADSCAFYEVDPIHDVLEEANDTDEFL